MGAKPSIDVAERRARLARRHHLSPVARAASALDVARGMVALHATDPATVYLSIFARANVAVGAVEDALYEARSLMRMLGMRRTMFVVPIEFAPVVQAACTRAIAAQERRRTVQLFGLAGIAGDISAWLETLEEQTVEALGKRGRATAQQLSDDVPALKQQVRIAAEKSYAGAIGFSTRVLFQLAADGRIVRGRPRGSWISGQYHWSPMDAWLPGGLLELLPGAAQTELIRGWLRAFGPGTLADLKWWTGLTLGEVRRALQELAAVEVELGEGSGWVLADDLSPLGPSDPWVSLLPALDPTPMGYIDRTWFLGNHAPAIFDRTGNIGPSVWCDGRIVGGWAQRKNGTIAYKLFEDIGAVAERAVESAAHDLGSRLGQVRVTPRFRTPLERELSA
ncbi:MAG TPA: winged helix DNA-binding domain-containing protein [Chloroflexota bacterium]|nr:winged helix DNA-binding domain-containing protein [Chloroflexota bacterium]